ncbi:MAG: hypothetical protein QOG53_2607 [Frankiales bacterium]|jgi:anti-sigma regulatory factor (Ser/Thr protein kinase)|nr:hypothetical protein [Frankiales bacterium]
MTAGTGEMAVSPGSHVVQFYDRDDDLIDSAASHLLAALDAGGVAIVVASEAHRRAFEARLSDLDVAAATARGDLVVLDAEATLRRFVIDDRPDGDAFEQIIGGLIEGAIRLGRPVHVYGEMVALLWEAGQVVAALELEGLWNELGKRLAFSLYCGYPSHSVAGDGHRDALHEVCRLHSSVVGQFPVVPGQPDPAGHADEVTRSFLATVDAPRAARLFVVEALRGGDAQALADDAAVVVTELATNAVVHARSEFTVTVSASRGAALISVRDASPVELIVGNAPLLAISGRGLGLVDAVANRWGADLLDDGKVVWAELRR